jgi:hypothetical protein
MRRLLEKSTATSCGSETNLDEEQTRKYAVRPISKYCIDGKFGLISRQASELASKSLGISLTSEEDLAF